MAALLLGYLGFAGPQVLQSLILWNKNRDSSYESLSANCASAARMRKSTEGLEADIKLITSNQINLDQIRSRLNEMRDHVRDLKLAGERRRRAFWLEVAVTVVTCVVMTLFAAFIIVRRSSALRSRLAHVSPLE
jgi:hypothetical protein